MPAVFLLLQLFTAFPIHAENLYVTPTGAGALNGSSWNNAFAGFAGVTWGSGAGQLGAGDTLWIAGGTYTGQLLLNGSGTAGNVINIKRARATNSECTSAAGWSAAYDAQVIINNSAGGICIYSSTQPPNGPGRFITIDGQVTDGIRCNFQNVQSARGISIDGWGSFNTTFRNVGAYGPSVNAITGYPWSYDCRCVYVGTYSGGDTTPYPADLTFDHCTFAGATAGIYFVHVANVTVQYCNIHTIENTSGNQAVHQNLIYVMSSHDCTFRYNTVHDCEAATGIFFTDYGSSGTVSFNFWIYGNVFRDDYLTSERFIDVRNTATGTGPLYFYNNTFVHGYGGILLEAPGNPNGITVIANNLFVDIGGYGAFIFVSYMTSISNLITSSYGMFVNPGAINSGAAPYTADWVRDLHLLAGSAPVNAGVNLGSPFNVDMDGNIRGADGKWDIGAYEYTSGTNPPADTTPPSVSLTAPVAGAIVSNTVTLTASASDNTGGSGMASVSFLVDGVTVGSVTTSPYTLAWSSLLVTNGSHTIQARAQDVAGNQASSSSFNVTVQNHTDTTPPSVSLTAPVAGAIVSNTVTLTASASDNTGGSGMASVSFLVDGVAVGSVTASPYTLAWSSLLVTNGSHTIQARAQDVAGNQAASATTTVTVQNPAAKGENLYVTPTGAGALNGSSWNNAFAGFAGVTWGSGTGQLGAGDTLWIAGGTYTGQLLLNGSGTAGNVINIKRARATNSECTSAAGWSAAYDAQVIINNSAGGICIYSSTQPPNGPGRFITIDGQVTDGIRCNFQNVSAARGISIDGWGSFNTTFRNIGAYGPSTNAITGYPWNYDCRCVYIGTYSGGDTTPYPADLTFDHCTFAGATAFAYYVHVANVTVQYCNIHTIENTSGNQTIHQNLIYLMSSHDCTFRYNTVHDCEAVTGMFFTDYGSSGTVSSNFWIYGNVFRDDYLAWDRFINVRNTATNTGPLYICNNTFVHGFGGVMLDAPGNPNGITVVANNLFVDIGAFGPLSYVSYVTTNANLITSSYAMFVNPGAINSGAAPYTADWVRDLHLIAGSAPVNAGVNLGSPFNVDMDGNIRGADGKWDIGAYENTAGTNPPADTTPPSVSLTAPVTGAIVSNAVTLTASASDNTGGSGMASVSFLVDGVAVGSVATAPYTMAWNSTVTNGSHTIQARAQDVAGNQASSATVTVTVKNVQMPEATNGLVGAWDFSLTNATTVPDSSGQGNFGTLVSPATCTQEELILNGTNGYMRVVSTPALEQVTNAVTISVWATINGTAQMQTIFRKVVSETTNLFPYSAYDLVIVDQGTTFMPRMGVTRTDSTRGLAYGAAHPYGALYHFAGTYDGTNLLIYVNGVLEGSAAFSGALLPTSSQPLCIGRFGASDETVKGSLGQARLYKRALSAAEIQVLAVPPLLPPQGLKVVIPVQ